MARPCNEPKGVQRRSLPYNSLSLLGRLRRIPRGLCGRAGWGRNLLLHIENVGVQHSLLESKRLIPYAIEVAL